MVESILLAPSVVVAVYIGIIGAKLRRMFTTYTIPGEIGTLSGRPFDGPSVTVCIPARNETHAMTDCLQGVLASTYSKLEILVLDDGSTDNTSALIKAFAHDGVRFIAGKELPEGWLGKNHALEVLLEEANGTYVIFLDVDTRIKPTTIEQLVMYMEQENAAMLSVLPQRSDSLRASTLFAPLRYFLELMIHIPTRPAAASSLWMVRRRLLLDDLSGFKPFRLNVQSESDIAAVFSRQLDYRLAISTPMLGVSYEKKWTSQVETSIRLLYPRLGGKVWKGALALLLFVLLWSPIGAFFLGFILHDVSILWVSAAEVLISTLVYGYYLSRMRQAYWWVGMWLWPLIITQESILLVISMVKYARHTVTWKGRPVTSPAVIRQIQQQADSRI
jgi:glycosyltransferase involved in cell wall biosynthesis